MVDQREGETEEMDMRERKESEKVREIPTANAGPINGFSVK